MLKWGFSILHFQFSIFNSPFNKDKLTLSRKSTKRLRAFLILLLDQLNTGQDSDIVTNYHATGLGYCRPGEPKFLAADFAT